jgi:hypothetical protein
VEDAPRRWELGVRECFNGTEVIVLRGGLGREGKKRRNGDLTIFYAYTALLMDNSLPLHCFNAYALSVPGIRFAVIKLTLLPPLYPIFIGLTRASASSLSTPTSVGARGYGLFAVQVIITITSLG